MPTPTRRTGRQRPKLASRSWPSRAILLASLLAGLELAATLLLGRFLELGRAEPLLFLAFRPWIMLAASLVLLSRPAAERLALYGLALLLAFAAESVVLLSLGSSDPWSAGARGLVAGAGVAIIFDLLIQLGRRFGRVALAGASLTALALLIIPGPLRPYEALVIGTAPAPAAGSKPGLMLFTALPIIWGEAGAFDPQARPAAAYRYLQQEFAIRPLDTLDPETLGGGRLLLLAQPRALSPGELVALDAWVRGGGRALILTDPALVWPSELPIGDLRRAPPISLLQPLLAHWGLALDMPRESAVRTLVRLSPGGLRRHLVLGSPGRFRSTGAGCAVESAGEFATCVKGSGRATLIADADLLNDALWLPPAAEGDLRRRSADNSVVVADMLDELSGIVRKRSVRAIDWIDPDASPERAILAGLLPLLLAAGLCLALLRVSRG